VELKSSINFNFKFEFWGFGVFGAIAFFYVNVLVQLRIAPQNPKTPAK